MCTCNYASPMIMGRLYHTPYLDHNPPRINITIENSYSLHITTIGRLKLDEVFTMTQWG